MAPREPRSGPLAFLYKTEDFVRESASTVMFTAYLFALRECCERVGGWERAGGCVAERAVVAVAAGRVAAAWLCCLSTVLSDHDS